MNLTFDIQAPSTIEFLVALGSKKEPDLLYVDVDDGIKQELIKMIIATRSSMLKKQSEPDLYDPANDYPNTSFIYMPLHGGLTERIEHLFNYGNPQPLVNPLEQFPKISLYCARLQGSDGDKLLAVKQTSDVGAQLQRQRGKIRIRPNRLELSNDAEFQLATVFDFLIEKDNAFILHHSAFEGASRLTKKILATAPANLNHISQQISFVDFSGLTAFAQAGMKQARLLASIKASGHAVNFEESYLADLCQKFNVPYDRCNGKMVIQPENALGFLDIIAHNVLAIRVSSALEHTYRTSNKKPFV